jgi:hypothetical protein
MWGMRPARAWAQTQSVLIPSRSASSSASAAGPWCAGRGRLHIRAGMGWLGGRPVQIHIGDDRAMPERGQASSRAAEKMAGWPTARFAIVLTPYRSRRGGDPSGSCVSSGARSEPAAVGNGNGSRAEPAVDWRQGAMARGAIRQAACFLRARSRRGWCGPLRARPANPRRDAGGSGRLVSMRPRGRVAGCR